ncbi:MAG TPA: hypothetical protein PKV16_03605 [Caldisericia bacterium]|nr:hypothetical protein [Caldisericia bacterium]HPF48397.1 hypothetical protein [Caldisericia bacterium]HPI83423.1 hypothetical protein [Caldisericia bacterium]HPQ92851.1 hypothetical protein [Caldisericia bacterium]HRV74051.1 hypothetical protein [Caldisericia bacterium]
MIDHNAIREAFLGLGLVGDESTGILRRFGVILKADNADYLVGREFDLIDSMGGEPSRKLAEKVLVDAAQWCAISTYRGITTSDEWNQLIEPNVQNIQDKLSAIFAITNCLGWGKVADWKLDESAKTLDFTVEHSYYVDAYKHRYSSESKFPICHMWTGVVGGIMDLLYDQKPHTFTGTEEVCAAMSGDVCKFSAKESKKKFGFDI